MLLIPRSRRRTSNEQATVASAAHARPVHRILEGRAQRQVPPLQDLNAGLGGLVELQAVHPQVAAIQPVGGGTAGRLEPVCPKARRVMENGGAVFELP